METYNKLFEKYQDEVQKLEELYKNASTQAVPHLVMNNRILGYSEHLNRHSRWCVTIKAELMPLIIEHIAENNSKNEEAIIEFKQFKGANKYMIYLDALLEGFIPFEEYCSKQIKYAKDCENRLKIPYRPTKSNATRQLSEYYENQRKYEEELESIANIREEAERFLLDYTQRLQFYKN